MNKNILFTTALVTICELSFSSIFSKAQASFTFNYSGSVFNLNGSSPILPGGIAVGTQVTGSFSVDDSLGPISTINGLPQFPVTNFSFSFPSFSSTITAPIGTQFFPGGSPTIQAVFGDAGVKPGNEYVAGAFLNSVSPPASASVVLRPSGFPSWLTFTDFATNGSFIAELAGFTGSQQSNPFLPTGQISNGWIFQNVPSTLWYDPPFSSSLTYTMTSPGSLFTKILDFPTGFSSPFEVTTGATSLGLFSPGQSVIFPNSGVSQFTISGIDPLVDLEDPVAFPLQLEFNTQAASFELSSSVVPEPLTLLGASTAIAFGAGFKRRAKKSD